MKYFTTLSFGETLGSHNVINRHVKSLDLTEVSPEGNYDVIVAYCPIVSRQGSDIEAALSKIPDGKPVILVILHHNMNPDFTIPDSSKQVTSRDDIFTVDYLFHDSKGGLLQCPQNNKAVDKMKKKIKSLKTQEISCCEELHSWCCSWSCCCSWFWCCSCCRGDQNEEESLVVG